MFIAWTTVETREDAERLAEAAVDAQLAVCVQIDGPVTSVYRWNARREHAQEFRLAFKCLPARLADLERQVLKAHPYETPEWIVVRAEQIGEKYLSWAKANSSPLPL